MASTNTIECSVCCDTIPATSDNVTITDDVVCLPCFDENIRPMFVAALEHEHDYPVSWGTTALDAQDFAKYLPHGFMLRWVFRKREYETPVKERVYCRHRSEAREECGVFFGAKAAATGAGRIYLCISCKRSTCGICAVSCNADGRMHVCGEPDGVVPIEDEDPFKGLERGRDFQLCPGCQVYVTLRDGCNHIVCTQSGCGTSFCYICGLKLARKEREHFKPGKPCPRYNQPGAKNAHHDHHHHHQEAEPTEWEIRVQAMVALIQLIAPLHDQAHVLADAAPRDDEVAQGMLGLMHQLEANIRMQVFDPESRGDIAIIEHERTMYLDAHRVVEVLEEDLDRDDGQWIGWPGLPDILELYHERHEAHIDALDTRLNGLWGPVLQALPPYFDRTLYRALVFPPANRHAHHSAKSASDEVLRVHEERRTEAQRALLQVASGVVKMLQWHVEYAAVSDVAVLQQVLSYARSERKAVDEGVEKVAEGVWNGYLGLRLAVEVYRGERRGFEERVKGRIEELGGEALDEAEAREEAKGWWEA
ncbi:hypothetical protein LTR85_009743 [Meristemomyces frigidus]|nr:hypothetical protein LTR85_009743 [Meristemomyces frigidus]